MLELLGLHGRHQRITSNTAQKVLLVKGADESHVELACLLASMLGVLVENGLHAHAKTFAKGGSYTAGAVLALVAVNEYRLVCWIHHDGQGGSDLFHCCTLMVTLVWSDRTDNMSDTRPLHVLSVRCWCFLVDESAAKTLDQLLVTKMPR